MSDKQPTTDAIAPKERPPFNEVSVLFPLLTLYTAGYIRRRPGGYGGQVGTRSPISS